MIMQFMQDLGLWIWWVIGLVLLALEVIVPGFFLIWIGLAALLVGTISLLQWNSSFWPWQVQLLFFAGFSVVSVFYGRKLALQHENSDEPFLNRRSESLVGRTATLIEPIINGHGRIRLDDTTWQVVGPDTSAGTVVRIIAAKGPDLIVDLA